MTIFKCKCCIILLKNNFCLFRAQEQSEMIVEMQGRLPNNDSAYSSSTSLPCVIEGKAQANNSNEVSSSSSKTVDKSGEQQMLELELQKSKAAYDRSVDIYIQSFDRNVYQRRFRGRCVSNCRIENYTRPQNKCLKSCY